MTWAQILGVALFCAFWAGSSYALARRDGWRVALFMFGVEVWLLLAVALLWTPT